MRIYEDQTNTSFQRKEPRSFYIPQGTAKYTLLNGEFGDAVSHMMVVFLYGAAVLTAAVVCFLRQMKKQ